jgi:PPIC-type PPIASE domain
VKRTLSVLGAAVCAAILLSACGGSIGPNAATVGSTDINRKDFEDELKTISENKAFQKTVDAQNVQNAQQNPSAQPLTIKVGDSGVSVPGLATPWLNSRVNQVIVDQVFKQRGLKVTAADRAAAKTAAERTFGTVKVFNEFPKSFRKELLARAARLEAVQTSLPKPAPPTDAQLEALVQQTKAQSCPSGKLVAVIVVPTAAAADAIRTQLAQGADFATIAKTQSSDTTSAAVGGLKACTDTQGYQVLDAAVRTAADATPSGSISATVPVAGGFEIVKVSPWDLANARPVIEQFYAQQQESPVAAFVNQRLVKAKVWVDPRYGTVRRANKTVTIVPPKTPNPRSSPTTTPTTSPTGAQAP